MQQSKYDKIYIDYNASTPVLNEVLDEINFFSTKAFYNLAPKYSHQLVETVEGYRFDIIKMLNGSTKDGNKLVFHAGGTDALNSFVQGVAFAALESKSPKKHIISTKIEHEAILYTLKYLETLGFEVDLLSVDEKGVISLDELKSLVREDTLMISVVHVNNETGVIQPLKQIVNIARKHEGIIVHSDGITAVGRLKIDIEDLGVDGYTISANKFFGPRAISCNYVKNNVPIRSILFGTPKEYGLRPGTENVTGMIGLHKALQIVESKRDFYIKKETDLLDFLEKSIISTIPNVSINSNKDVRICNTLSVSILGVDAPSLSKAAGDNGVCISSIGDGKSHVLEAMGVSGDVLQGSIRLSISARYNTKNELKKAIDILSNTVSKLKNNK